VNCLNCNREFPAKVDGEVEAGGLMLCRGCGHVMAWTKELTLRELTEAEHTEAGTNSELMRERKKIMPHRGVQYRGSWVLLLTMTIILTMAILERTHVIAGHRISHWPPAENGKNPR
jgi:hypothetical protein